MVEPVSVLLKYGFLVVLFLFLVWVSRNSLRDLRERRDMVVPVPDDGTGLHPAPPPDVSPQLVVERAPGHEAGLAYDIGSGAVLGRGEQAEIRLQDPFASARHARVIRQGSAIVLEDLGSTNGTYLNEELLEGPQPLHQGDRIRIGDSEFTFEDA